MEMLRLGESDKENSIKYIYNVDGKDVGCGYIFKREVNPIEIYIDEEYQSNGYGRVLFNSLLDFIIGRGKKGMIFELEPNQFKFMNIIQKHGAVEIGRSESKIKFILKI